VLVRAITPFMVTLLAGVVAVAAGGDRDAGASEMPSLPALRPAAATAVAVPARPAQLAADADGGAVLAVPQVTLAGSTPPHQGIEAVVAPRKQTAPDLDDVAPAMASLAGASDASSQRRDVDAVPLAASTPLLLSPVASALSPHRPAPFGGRTAPADPASVAAPSAGGPFVEAGAAIADAGVAIGKGAARGGAATGGFFTRLGKRVAQSF
jgi:hypothetical protein